MDAIIVAHYYQDSGMVLKYFFSMRNSLVKVVEKETNSLKIEKNFSLWFVKEFLPFLLMDEELGGKENYPIPANSKVDSCISNSPFPSKFLPPPILSCNQQYYLSTHEVRFEKFTWNTPSGC